MATNDVPKHPPQRIILGRSPYNIYRTGHRYSDSQYQPFHVMVPSSEDCSSVNSGGPMTRNQAATNDELSDHLTDSEVNQRFEEIVATLDNEKQSDQDGRRNPATPDA